MADHERKKAHVLLVVAGLILASVFSARAWINGKERPNIVDGCLKIVTGKTVIVLDHSEAIAKQTKDEIVARIFKFIESNEKVQVGDLVSVFTVSRLSKQNLRPIFSYCKQNAEGNQLIEKRKLVEEKYLLKFKKPLLEAVSAEIQGSTESPIAQAIIDLSLSEYLRGARHANLLIFSDMIEHTKQFSMYHSVSKDKCIQDYKQSVNSKQETPVLQNVDVVIALIPRSNFKGAELKCRDGFWPWFFRDNRGGTFEPSYLPGPADSPVS